MTHEEIALRIFCAMISRTDAKVSIHTEHIGEQQMQTAFGLADTFIAIRNERRLPNPPPPQQDTGGIQKRGL